MSSVVIDAQLVKTLRERTNAGLMECKRTLAETNGDIEAAIDLLRKKGAAGAAKKADREAKDGVIAQAIAAGSNAGLLVEINCETDFVAKNESFKAFAADVAKRLLADPSADLEADRIAAVQMLGENLRIRRHARIDAEGSGLLAAYIHTGSKLGVLVEVSVTKEATLHNEAFKQMVCDLAMQVAASNPISVDRGSVPADIVEREREICRGQVPAGKPANIIEQIIDGKMKNFFSQSCLVDQSFVKDPDLSVSQVVEQTGKAVGDTLTVRRFLRYAVGQEE